MGGSKLVFNQLGEGSKGTFLRSRQFMDDHGLVLTHSFIDSFASNDSNFLFPEFFTFTRNQTTETNIFINCEVSSKSVPEYYKMAS